MGKFNGIAMLVTSSGRPVHIEWALSLPALQYPMGMSVAWFLARGKERAEQRDALASRAAEIGAEYMFFLDDDTVCPNYTLQQLHYEMAQRPDVGVIGGIYCTKAEPPEPLVFKELGGGPFYEWTLGDVFECKGIATGAMMIKTSILKNIPKPWFKDFQDAPIGKKVDYNGVVFDEYKDSGTDDLYFCRKVTEAGYKILAHGGVLPVHIDQEGKYYTLPLDSYPCKSFDKEIAQAKAEGKRNLIITVEKPIPGGDNDRNATEEASTVAQGA